MVARSSLVVGTALVAMMVVGAVHTGSREMSGSRQVLMAAPVVPAQQSAKLADRVDDLLTGAAPEARRLRVFVKSVERCVCTGERPSDGACRKMGELLLRQQELEREGRKPQVAAFLNKVREARASGTPEAQVRAMVRDGLANGELSLSADAESRAVKQQLDELNRQLVGGEMLATGGSSELVQVSAR